MLLVERLEKPEIQKALLLVGTSLIVALLLAPSLTVSTPSYSIGDVAKANLKAKRGFLLLDEEATRRKRLEAAASVPLVFDFHEKALPAVQSRLTRAFETMRSLQRKGDPDPQGIPAPDRAVETGWTPPTRADIDRRRYEVAMENRKTFEAMIGFRVPESVFRSLASEGFSVEIEEKLSTWLEKFMSQGIVANPTLVGIGEGNGSGDKPGRAVAVRHIPSLKEEIHSTVDVYRDLDSATAALSEAISEEVMDPELAEALIFLGSRLLEPNIFYNRVETEHREARAADAVKPVYVAIKKNEMLIREGQRIGVDELRKLQAYAEGRHEYHCFLAFITIFLFIALYLSLLIHVAHRHIPGFQLNIRDYLFLGAVLVLILAMGRYTAWISEAIGTTSSYIDHRTLVFATPLTTGAMLASIFFGVTPAFLFSLTLSLFLGILFGSDFDLFMFSLMGCFVGVHGVTPCRNRMIPIKTGLLVGCTNVIVVVLSMLFREQWPAPALFANASVAFCGGVMAGILVTGLAPLAEMAFGYTTDIKLLELASMDQPLLQELLLQAPGTYHHSIIVGNMVEAAAKSIGANSLLAKVAAYYHDIGKIRKPSYFIENQFDCENRHEKLAPSMSSLILISHVKEGVDLAKKHKLGQPIIDIIRQHHGRSLISYFYQKALDAREKAQSSKGADLPPINIEDYRYPGPKPQTKEAGLVMLADIVEAACRSLNEPTPARIQGLVNKLINNVFIDGQLDECELTLKDLHQIAKHFNQILATVHHKRIEYPSVPQPGTKARGHASDPNQREPKCDRDRSSTSGEGSRNDLKRLGLH